MPSQPKPRPPGRTANPSAPVKHRRRFSLRGWPRRSRQPDERANLRAGVDAPHGYPFEPRF
jgi:hypothetical protein